VTLRVAALGDADVGWSDLPEVGHSEAIQPEITTVFTDTGEVEATVVERPALGAGDRIFGPAVIREPEATTWIPPGCSAAVHTSGAIEVTW
jgi:N-methylhydantoinase A